MKPIAFELVVERITVAEDAATIDLKQPTPPGKTVPDEYLAKVGAWFAGRNDEFGPDAPLRVAIYQDDGHRFHPGQRVRITVEPIVAGDSHLPTNLGEPEPLV